MKNMKLFEAFVNEGKFAEIHKAVKKGDYPVTIVVHAKGTKGVGAVRHQELVNTPQAVPAAYSVLKKKYYTDAYHFTIEDATGKILWQSKL